MSLTHSRTVSRTITNDDSATLTVAAPSITETNVDQDVTFTVTLDHEVQGGVDVVITKDNRQAGNSDYTLVTTSLHFAGTVGESHDVTVTITCDEVVKDNETSTIGLGAISNTPPAPTSTLSPYTTLFRFITNDDSATLTVAAPSITETNVDQDVTFTVTLDHEVQG